MVSLKKMLKNSVIGVSGLKVKEELARMWEIFIETGTIDSRLDKLIQNSWIRSMQNKVDPYQKAGQIDLDKWEESIKKNSALIETSLPLMKNLYHLVEDSGFTVILCDENGLLLEMIGDETTLEEAKLIRFQEGADWSEEAMGTNAIGTSIIEGHPLQVYAHEHYSQLCQRWTCSAAPIFGPNGKLIGVLNMSGPFEKVHPHTLGMVVSAAKAVENLLKLQEKTRKNELMKSYLEATIDTLTSGILLVNQQGKIIQANQTLKTMIQMNEDELLDRSLEEIFTNSFFLRDIRTQGVVRDKDIRLKVKGLPDGKHVLLNIKPVYQEYIRIGSLLTIQEIREVRQLVNQVTGNRAKITFDDIIGKNTAFLKRIKEAESASASLSNVLLLGESGTGKDMFAQAIHNASDRFAKPFVAINCGAIPRELLGSELFGYAEGAFTGARKGGYSGKFELADGGTIFLDEIGEMSLDMQVLLLRVIQNKEIVRIGEHKVIPVDVRIIAATNKNLKEEVQKGSFREDLYFRLNVLPISIPSLRERRDDIPLLASHFISEINERLPGKHLSISPSYIKAIQDYSWPGNVRELQNVIERSVNHSSDGFLRIDDLPEDIKRGHPGFSFSHHSPFKKEDMQKKMLLYTIEECNYNYSKAAKKLGISRSTLYRRMDRFNIK